ncbi:MAG: aldolase/citrate lyase family protein [Thermoanaerobaculia bacterium]|nr:aldolase/citrate lyase family protein [Thermoanaerobaculia bacterium]
MMDARSWLLERPRRIGPFLRIPRAELVEMLAFAGFDFAILDLEHGPGSISEVYPLVLAAERRGLRLLARIPLLEESWFKWLLDLGIGGIQVPHIKSREDAEKAVEWSLFSPEGARGLCRFVRAAEFSNVKRQDYVFAANHNRLLVLQIEGKDGLEQVDSITDVRGIDVLFVGPYDLSQSIGLTGQIWHPRVLEAIEHVLDTCRRKGIETGVFTDTPEGLAHWKERSVRYIAYRVETEILLSSFKGAAEEARRALGDD